MRAVEECIHCHHCKLGALWGRPDLMTGHLWTERSGGESEQCLVSDKSQWEWIIKGSN